ncbi:MAG: hypothetical protein KTR30_10270 [Saprospiraceae bacterium]|nr:hypothetical protein [Saprospiraceae bacterium]
MPRNSDSSTNCYTYRILRSGILTLLLILLIPLPSSTDCGPISTQFHGYSFLKPDIAKLKSPYAPFTLGFAKVFELYPGHKTVQEQQNINEWWERYCEVPSKADIDYIVYAASIRDLNELRSTIEGELLPWSALGPPLSSNTFARYLYRYKCAEAIDYLIFAKQCEPHATSRRSWETDQKDLNEMENLIEQGQVLFKRTKSEYFRLRYVYQIVRLAHYMKNYRQTIALYEYLMPKVDNDPSLIEYWVLGHYAGALLEVGQTVRAAYLFSQIFDKCPSKRYSAFQSFTIKTDQDWEECLLMCKDNHERAVLHVLRAESQNAKLVEEMRNIYRYEPTNENLELLLLREIKRLEKDLLGLDFNNRRRQNERLHNIPRPDAGEKVIELQKFIREIEDDGLMDRPEIWKLAEGYLELLAGNYYFAAQSFNEVRDLTENDTLINQLEAFELALQISDWAKAESEIEDQAAEIQRTSEVYREFSDFPDFMRDKLTKLYRESGDAGKAFLAQYSIKDLKINSGERMVDNLLEICRNESANRFERSLVLKPDGSTIEEDLLNLKTNHFLSRGEIEKALETYKRIPLENWDNFGLFYPYLEQFKDTIRYSLPTDVQVFNKGEVLQDMVRMEYMAEAEQDRDKAAEIYYRLGLAFYNMTYFGYSWKMLDLYRSGASMQRLRRGSGNYVVSHPQFPLGNKEFFDCSVARLYFERARITAIDREITAKALFMAAKCEQNAYFVDTPAGTAPLRENFALLRENYSDTDMYQLIRSKCKYFEAYISK